MIGNKASEGHNGEFEDDAVNIQTAEAVHDSETSHGGGGQADYTQHRANQKNQTNQVNQGNQGFQGYNESNVRGNADDSYDASGAGSGYNASHLSYTYPTFGGNGPTGHLGSASAPADDFKQSQEQAKYLGNKASDFVDTHGGSHFLLLIASFLLLVKASLDIAESEEEEGAPGKNHKQGYGFALFIAILSLILCSVHFYATAKSVVSDQIKLFILIILLFFWGLAVAVLTFGETYKTTGNGYFTTWLGFFLSLKLVSDEIQQVNVLTGKFKAMGWQLGTLLIAAAVLFFASISPCRQEGGCSGGTAFSLAAGLIAIPYVLFMYYFMQNLGEKVRLVVAGVNMALWIAVVFVCTFSKPFTETGNGYFASWIGLFASILLFHKMTRTSVEVSENTRNVDMV